MLGARTVIRRMLVVPAEAGIQHLKSLDPGQKHAGMTIKWDSNGSDPFTHEQEILKAFEGSERWEEIK